MISGRTRSTSSGRPDLSLRWAPGSTAIWAPGEILSLTLTEGDDGLILRAYARRSLATRLGGKAAVALFEPRLAGSQRLHGPLQFRIHDDANRRQPQVRCSRDPELQHVPRWQRAPAYFCREFFHQILSSNSRAVEVAGSGDASAVRCRMAGDDPHDHVDRLPGTVDLSPLLGPWPTLSGFEGDRSRGPGSRRRPLRAARLGHRLQ